MDGKINIRIEPPGQISFIQPDGTEYILSHEAIEFYFELKKNSKIIQPMDPETGAFVYKDGNGSPCCYLPAGITVSGRVKSGDVYTLE